MGSGSSLSFKIFNSHDGKYLLSLIEKSVNRSVLRPEEQSFINNLKFKIAAKNGKAFEYTPSILNDLRKIASIICWDLA